AATWNGKWQQAQSQADGFWNFECAIPIASMSHAGAGRKATDGTWMINLCRDWRPDWGWSSFTGKYPWSGITFRFVDGTAPVVRQVILGDPSYPPGGAELQLILSNPTAAPMSLNTLLHLVRNNMPEVNERQAVSLGAIEEKSIIIKLDGNDPTTIYN